MDQKFDTPDYEAEERTRLGHKLMTVLQDQADKFRKSNPDLYARVDEIMSSKTWEPHHGHFLDPVERGISYHRWDTCIMCHATFVATKRNKQWTKTCPDPDCRKSYLAQVNSEKRKKVA